jgi:hypothetical protein
MRQLVVATGMTCAWLGCGSAVETTGSSPPTPPIDGGSADAAASDAGGRTDAGADGVGSWQRLDACPESGCDPSIVSYRTAAWTGSRVIFWAADLAFKAPQGEVFDPTSGTFTSFPAQGAPWSTDMAFAWTGTRVFAWVGPTSGALYDPSTDIWAALPSAGAPTPRAKALAVVAGGDVIVWGGSVAGADPGGGGSAYGLAQGSWRPMAQANQPSFRALHTAVWTGAELVVWGGTGTHLLDTGGRYEPAHDTWRPTSTSGAPNPRVAHTAVWTGSEMVVWGGQLDGGAKTDTGGVYDPAADAWRATSRDGAPKPRKHHFAAWTGRRMLIMGGELVVGLDETLVGGIYDPVTDRWQSTTEKGAPGNFFQTQFTAWDEAHGRLLVVGGTPGASLAQDKIQAWAYTPPAP